MSSVLFLPEERYENGYEVLEGEGTWMHWAIYNRPRLDALKRQAIARLEALHQHFDVRAESEDGEITSRLRTSAIKKKVSTCLWFGWKSYTEYNTDFEAGFADSIIEYLSKRSLVSSYVDTVLRQFHELDYFLTASDSSRVLSTSKNSWLHRRSYDLRDFCFFASESDSRRVRLYPLLAQRMTIILDKRLTLERCHAQFFYLQACYYLRSLTIIFTIGLCESQLANFRSLLCDVIRPARECFTLNEQLKLVLKFPRDCCCSKVLYTGHVIMRQSKFEVVLVWRGAVFNHTLIGLWAYHVGLNCR